MAGLARNVLLWIEHFETIQDPVSGRCLGPRMSLVSGFLRNLRNFRPQMTKRRGDGDNSDGRIPPQVFEVLRELYPVGVGLLDALELSMADLLTLSHLRASPARFEWEAGTVKRAKNARSGHPARLVAEVNETLSKALRHDEGWVTTTVSELLKRGLVARIDISETLRAEVFKETFPGKQSRIVLLTGEGDRVLEEFNSRLSALFQAVVGKSKIRRSVVGLLMGRFVTVAPELIAAVRSQRAMMEAALRRPQN
jgi:hypothetical protein